MQNNVILPSKLFHKLKVGRVLLHYFRVCLRTRCKSYYCNAFYAKKHFESPPLLQFHTHPKNTLEKHFTVHFMI